MYRHCCVPIEQDWEQSAEANENHAEGEDEEEMETEGLEVEPTRRIKKKPFKVEDDKPKKEHVNVVFIGHVGKLH